MISLVSSLLAVVHEDEQEEHGREQRLGHGLHHLSHTLSVYLVAPLDEDFFEHLVLRLEVHHDFEDVVRPILNLHVR